MRAATLALGIPAVATPKTRKTTLARICGGVLSALAAGEELLLAAARLEAAILDRLTRFAGEL
jgi:hypothetical protein